MTDFYAWTCRQAAELRRLKELWLNAYCAARLEPRATPAAAE